ncbi:MAG: single-stranded DNA-binding protein [Chlamydiae bacterium]|nr:single-stranded DNA-binding protein [Chlamydiota bacterium]
MVNQAFIAGHLGADPEVRFTSSGQKVTTLRVGARGRKGESIWWKASVWGEQFDKMIAYLKKGSPIMVFGEISKPEIYTDKEGKPQTSLQITATNLLFSPFGKPEGSSTSSNSSQEVEMALAATAETVSGQGKMDLPFSDEELPF